MSGSEFEAARNGQQAYAQRLKQCLDILEGAYTEAAAKQNSFLSSSRVEELRDALETLKVYFPDMPDIEVNGIGKSLVRDLAFAYVSVARHEDSVMREHLQAYCHARLYAARPSARASDLTSDPCLSAMATADPLPLSLLLGENSARAGNFAGVQTITFGQRSMLPVDLMDASRPTGEMEAVAIARKWANKKAKAILDAFGPLVRDIPWGRRMNKGSLVLNGACGATAANTSRPVIVPEAISTKRSVRDVVEQYADLLANGQGIESKHWNAHDSEVCAVILQRGDAAIARTNCGISFRVYDNGTEISGMVRTVDVGGYFDLQVVPFVDGVAQAAYTITRNGANGGSTPVNTGTFDFQEYETGDARIKALTFRLRNLGPAHYRLSFIDPRGAAAAAAVSGIIINSTSPANYQDADGVTDNQRLDNIHDMDMVDLIQNFLHLRNEVSKNGVDESWYLKSYARYIFANPIPYQDGVPLTANQVTAIKTRMLNVTSWESFVDLKGFLNKIYDDAGTLVALVQATDFL